MSRGVRINTTDLQVATRFVERAGVDVWIEKRLHAKQPYRGGAPRQLTVKGLLTLMFALARFGHKLHLERVYELVYTNADQVDSYLLHELGIVNDDGDHVSYGQIQYLFARIADALDPSPHQFCQINGRIRNPRMVTDQQRDLLDGMRGRHRCLQDHLTDEQGAYLEENREALQQFLDEFLDASLPEDRGCHDGSYAIDASPFAAWSRGRRTPTGSSDPDAGWSVKKADGSTYVPSDGEQLPSDGSKPRKRGHGGTTKGGRKYTTPKYGYDVHSVTWIPEQGGGDVPNLTERLVVFGGGRSDIRKVAEVVEQLHAAGRPVHDLIIDRWYSTKKADNFHLPLRRIGATLTMDYRTDERGVQGTWEGALIIDGQLYCPALPEELRDIPAPYFKNMSERLRIAELIRERQKYALSGRGGKLGCGTARVSSPAQRRQVRCGLVPESMQPLPDATPAEQQQELAKPTTLPMYTPKPATKPKVCSQVTIGVPEHVLAKNAQKHPYLSKAWWDSYDRRPYAESTFGILRNPGVTDIHKGAFQVRGIAKTSIVLAMWTAAANIVIADAFEREHTAVLPRRAGRPAGDWRHFQSRSERRRRRRQQGVSVIHDLIRGDP